MGGGRQTGPSPLTSFTLCRVPVESRLTGKANPEERRGRAAVYGGVRVFPESRRFSRKGKSKWRNIRLYLMQAQGFCNVVC